MASSGRFVRTLSRLQAAGLVVFVAMLALTSGCDTKIGNGVVSTSTFESLALTESVDQQAIQVLSDKIDLLKSISPTTVEAVLNEQQANSFPLGTLNLAPGGFSSVLIFEANLRAICSVDLCELGTCQLTAPRVQLHYNDVGFEEELEAAGVGEPFPTFSQSVPSVPVDVSRGAGLGGDRWLVSYEPRSRSLVGMRARDVGYRNVSNPNDPDDPNFGRGNGLVMSVIISGPEMQSQLGLATQPRITRIFDLGPDPSPGSNKHRLLVFFAREVLREVHVLELEAGVRPVRTNLAPGGGNENVWMLNGQFRRFGPAGDQPFMTLDEIKLLTQEVDVDIGSFQPIKVNTDGSALVFDSESSQFLRLKPLSEEDVLNVPGKFPGQGVVEVAVQTSVIEGQLGSRGSAFEFTEAWPHPENPEIVLVEERSNTVLAYDYTLPANEDNAYSVINAINMTSNRRDPFGSAGGGVLINNEEPILLKAEEDILSNRLMFDRGRDELIAINYETGTVVIVAKRAAFTNLTGVDLADITYIKYTGVERPDDMQSDDMQSVRVWDSSSSSLLKVLLEIVLEPTTSINVGN
ncbi:MAG: hypothetical protein VX958_02140 [Planctomycetota bacterium]|nr:hypothetical protein [Planctomycetota bacterium]